MRKASMRPEDFSPGNPVRIASSSASPITIRFNEAGGFLPRKPEMIAALRTALGASMRPEDFSPGNA